MIMLTVISSTTLLAQECGFDSDGNYLGPCNEAQAAPTTFGGSGNSVGGNSGTPPSGFVQIGNPIKADSIGELVKLLMKAIIDIGSIIAVFFVIWSGLKFVKARGNPEAIGDAQKTLMYTLIGIAILFGAQLIAALITNTVENVGSGVIQ